jgi:hypothetical protein
MALSDHGRVNMTPIPANRTSIREAGRIQRMLSIVAH